MHIYAQRIITCGPLDSRHETLTAEGEVTERTEEGVRFRALNGEERFFPFSKWAVDIY